MLWDAGGAARDIIAIIDYPLGQDFNFSRDFMSFELCDFYYGAIVVLLNTV